MKQHCVCIAYDAVSSTVQAVVRMRYQSTYCWCVSLNEIDRRTSVICSACCCSSLLLQQLKSVLVIVRASVSSVDCLTVICEKHQVLPTEHDKTCGQGAWKQKSETLQAVFQPVILPDNTSCWWWCTDSGFYVSAAPFWDALCSTGWDGSAPHRGSHGSWLWHMRSVGITSLLKWTVSS